MAHEQSSVTRNHTLERHLGPGAQRGPGRGALLFCGAGDVMSVCAGTRARPCPLASLPPSPALGLLHRNEDAPPVTGASALSLGGLGNHCLTPRAAQLSVVPLASSPLTVPKAWSPTSTQSIKRELVRMGPSQAPSTPTEPEPRAPAALSVLTAFLGTWMPPH